MLMLAGTSAVLMLMLMLVYQGHERKHAPDTKTPCLNRRKSYKLSLTTFSPLLNAPKSLLIGLLAVYTPPTLTLLC